jgi:hypothetical protein
LLRVELHRWPREDDWPIAEGISGPIKRYASDIKVGYGGGLVHPLVHVRLIVGGFDISWIIVPDDTCMIFEVDLNAGEERIQTYLMATDGRAIGAYYVYVKFILVGEGGL